MGGQTLTIKAIETSYAGYRFRSRLEARWAVFLDTLKIEWQYEPQGYEFNGWHYLPDFYLPASDLYVEVKGTDETLHATLDRLRQFAVAVEKPLVILGDVPKATTTQNAPVFSTLRPEASVALDSHALVLRGTTSWLFTPIVGHRPCTPSCITTKIGTFGGIHPTAEIVNAYATARSARFEHGQTPPHRTAPAAPPQPTTASTSDISHLFRTDTPPNLAIGDQVEHDRYGPGVVIATDGEGPRKTVMINFQAHGQIRLMLIGGVPLRKIPA